MGMFDFMGDAGDLIQSSAEQVFSNITEVATASALENAPSWVVWGEPDKGNLTADQVAKGVKGVNENAVLPARTGVASEQLQNGLGINFQNTISKIGPIGIIGVAIIAALLLRKKRK